MTKTIAVSTDVYAAIWGDRRPGEESEDDILRRRFLKEAPPEANSADQVILRGDGMHDTRNGVHFPEGFEIIRNYKGKKYSAIARSGCWIRQDNGKRYTSLNQLNASIVSGIENVWNGNWKYKAETGTLVSINGLRP